MWLFFKDSFPYLSNLARDWIFRLWEEHVTCIRYDFHQRIKVYWGNRDCQSDG